MHYVTGFDSHEVRETVLDDFTIYDIVSEECDGDMVLVAMSLVFMWHDPNYLMLSDIERKAGKID